MELIDLNHVIEAGMITYPGLPGPVITDHWTREASRQQYSGGEEFRIGRIDMIANTGTYVDAPSHRFRDGADLAALPLSSLAALDGVVVDARERPAPAAVSEDPAPAAVSEDPGRAAGAELLDGLDVRGRAVLFHTGWDAQWGADAYVGEHPYLSVEAVERLIADGAALVGIDSSNIDDTSTGTRPVHTALLAAGIPVVEHLSGLDRLHGHRFRFFAVPPRIRGLDSFPVRAFALLDG